MGNEPEKRSADSEGLVPVDSEHPAHADMFQTLDLLSINTTEGRAFFIIEGCANFQSIEDLQHSHQFFYEEHTCPVNFIRIPATS